MKSKSVGAIPRTTGPAGAFPLAAGSPSEKERARQRAKYHANKGRDRDLAKGFDFFWAKRGGRPA